MACESWKERLDSYLDSELPEDEMRAFDVHVHSCPACAADGLARVQIKRAMHVAGRRYSPSADFRRRMEQKVLPRRRRIIAQNWKLAASALALLLIGALTSVYTGTRRSHEQQLFSEVADLHITALASASPVDVISTDRHTVKPWFQGKIPFAIDLPELSNSEFSLLGGRVTYLNQSPGAHLIYAVRKHRISVFVFRNSALQVKLGDAALSAKQTSFNTATWTKGDLRYVALSDASKEEINTLAGLFKNTSP
ncbi:MAG: anti-sigma factor [Acidobacteriota bacterium]|nr:anti-sigma factor [Acidobacteriota bacterium]